MFREMRRRGQALSREECVSLLKTEKRGALAMSGDNGYPYAIPLNFYFDEAENKIYFHCAKEGHKLDAIKNDGRVCFTVWDRGEKRGGDWAYHVKSVVVMGRARLVDDKAVIYEKTRAIGLKYYPDAGSVDEELRRAISRVALIELAIEHITGKMVHEK